MREVWRKTFCVGGLLCVLSGITAVLAVSHKPAQGIHPIVVAETDDIGLLLGGAANGKWHSAADIAKLMHGNESYRLYSRTQYLGNAEGSRPQSEASVIAVRLKPQGKRYEVAISGKWNALPRRAVAKQPSQSLYIDSVRSILKQHGLKQSAVNVTKAFRVDLDADGTQEVILAARSKDYDPIVYRKGQYSLVALRKTIAGKAKTFLLNGDFHIADSADREPEHYDIRGFWDVDGDGALEIGVGWSIQRLDAGGISVYDWSGKKPVLLSTTGVGH